MSDSGENAPSPAPLDEKKRPGRPRKTGTETPQQRIERLQAELQKAQDALKISDEKRAAIVGAAALRHARRHEDFRRELTSMLRVEVKAKADRAAIADLLQEDIAASSSS